MEPAGCPLQLASTQHFNPAPEPCTPHAASQAAPEPRPEGEEGDAAEDGNLEQAYLEVRVLG